MQLKTITELLNLPNFQVVSVLEHNKTSIHLYIDLVKCRASFIHPQRRLDTRGGSIHVR